MEGFKVNSCHGRSNFRCQNIAHISNKVFHVENLGLFFRGVLLRDALIRKNPPTWRTSCKRVSRSFSSGLRSQPKRHRLKSQGPAWGPRPWWRWAAWGIFLTSCSGWIVHQGPRWSNQGRKLFLRFFCCSCKLRCNCCKGLWIGWLCAWFFERRFVWKFHFQYRYRLDVLNYVGISISQSCSWACNM